MVCYYFIGKASRLLPNKKFIVIVLRLVFAITLVIVLSSGIILFQGIAKFIYQKEQNIPTTGTNPGKLCANTLF